MRTASGAAAARIARGAVVFALALLPAASAKEALPASGPLRPATMQRLLLADATRAGNRVIAVGDRGYIAYSDDNGATWSRAKAPAAPLLTAIEFADARTGWAVGHDSVILATTDGGLTWAQQFSAPAEQRPLLDVAFVSAKEGFAVGAYGAFYQTKDGGARWQARKVIDDDKHLNGIVALGKDRLVIVGESGTILRSTDAGATWKPVVSPYKGSFFGAAVARDGSVIAFGLRGRVFRSTDAGSTWSAAKPVTEAALASASVLPEGGIAVVGNAGTLLLSRDNGQTFAPVATGRRNALGRALPGAADSLLVFGEGGVSQVSLKAP